MVQWDERGSAGITEGKQPSEVFVLFMKAALVNGYEELRWGFRSEQEDWEFVQLAFVGRN